MTDAFRRDIDRTPRRVVVKFYCDGDGAGTVGGVVSEFAQRVVAGA